MGYLNNGIGAARIDDSSPSDHTTYSSNKIETKQNSTDNTLTTTSKTIVGAINEVNSKANSKFIVVQTLPVSDIDELAIYLVPKSTAQTNNVYDEYIYISTNTPAHWEKIGDTEIDLSGYYTSSQVDTLLADKQDVTDNSLATTDKTIVGAINELNTDKADKAVITNIPTISDTAVSSTDLDIYSVTLNKGTYIFNGSTLWKTSGTAQGLTMIALLGADTIVQNLEYTVGWCVENLTCIFAVPTDNTTFKIRLYQTTGSNVAVDFSGNLTKIS